MAHVNFYADSSMCKYQMPANWGTVETVTCDRESLSVLSVLPLSSPSGLFSTNDIHCRVFWSKEQSLYNLLALY